MSKIAFTLIYATIGIIIFEYNQDLFYYFNHIKSEFWINENLFITTMADGFFIVLFMLYTQKKKKRTISSGFIIFIIVTILVQVIKEMINAPRPIKVFPEDSINLYGILLTKNSFPSGHSAAAFFLARLMTWKRKEFKVHFIWIFFGINAALSRVVIGVHFPIDVFIGSLIGYYGTHFLLKFKLLDKISIIRFISRITPFFGFLISGAYLILYEERIPEYEFFTLPLVTISFFYFAYEFFFSEKKYQYSIKLPQISLIRKRNKIKINFLPVITNFLILIILLLKPFKKIFLSFMIIVMIAYSMEFSYFFHLARYQWYVITHLQTFENVIKKENNSKKLQKLKDIYEAIHFAKLLYDLRDSGSFNLYVDLKRTEIGHMITVTPEFSLKPIEFQMPIVGSFSYLGFMDNKIMNRFIKKYKRKGHDIHISTIGAYSTLHYFPTPLLNTYLEDNEEWILELIFHELTHEKLFFKNDVFSSEQLAVTMQKTMLKDFYLVYPKLKSKSKKILKKQSQSGFLINNFRKELNLIYQSKRNIFYKRILKHFTYQKFYLEYVKIYQKNYGNLDGIIPFSKLNNATLAQYKRYHYSPQLFHSFLKECNLPSHDKIYDKKTSKNLKIRILHKKYRCFFQKLDFLAKCPKNIRQKSIENGLFIEDEKKACL